MREYNEVDFYDNEIFSVYKLDEKIRYQLAILDGLDPFTRRHSENVAKLTLRLCDKLRMDEGYTIYCGTCAYLHDVGKMFTPAEVLQKPGKLTEEEFEIMKQHTVIGYNICFKDPDLRPYAAGALYHHEALDGTGYPNGLIGDQILYEGQIIRVADEFDAITSKRQYKSHIGVVDTLKILIENSKPTSRSKALPGHSKPTVGKNNKQIVAKLIDIVLEDSENEKYIRAEYIKYLKKERKRYQDSFKYYQKSINENREEHKEYFKQYAQGYLTRGEIFEDIPKYLQDIEQAIKAREETLQTLIQEIKEIKKLRV